MKDFDHRCDHCKEIYPSLKNWEMYCEACEDCDMNILKALYKKIDDLEQTLGIVYFNAEIKSHFPETHKMVSRALKEVIK